VTGQRCGPMRLDARGMARQAEEAGLTPASLGASRAWLEDASPGQPRARAFPRRQPGWLGRLSTGCRGVPRRAAVPPLRGISGPIDAAGAAAAPGGVGVQVRRAGATGGPPDQGSRSSARRRLGVQREAARVVVS
jgi:hypothetical protein